MRVIFNSFFKWAIPGLSTFIFVFWNKHYNFTRNICEKCQSTRFWDSNKQTSENRLWILVSAICISLILSLLLKKKEACFSRYTTPETWYLLSTLLPGFGLVSHIVFYCVNLSCHKRIYNLYLSIYQSNT